MQTAGNASVEEFVAFLADANSERMVRQCIADLGITRGSVHRAGIDDAISRLEHSRSPRALIVDISGAAQPVAKIHELSEVCEPGTGVLVVGDRNDVALYRNLLNTGVSDYLVKPVSRSLFQGAIATLLGLAEQPGGKEPAQIIAVAGTRGGVGVSTIATNLAVALAGHRALRVALIDLDLFHGSCDLLLGVTANSGLSDALGQPDRIDALLLDRAAIACVDGLSLFASRCKPEIAARIDPLALPILLGQMRRQFDFLILDARCVDTPILRAAIEQAQIRVIVIDQTMLALRDLVDQPELFAATDGGQRNLIVVNRFGEHGKEGLVIADIEKTMEQPVDALIPFDARTAVSSANAGMPVVKSKSPVAKAITAIAEELLGHTAAQATRSKPWWKFFGR
jgi:pilus assembly protein CpaE